MSATSEELTRTVLLDKYSELHQRLQRIEADRQRAAAPLSPDFEEQAVERENDEVLERLSTATRQQLNQVRRALDHIDIGQYGICSICQQPIRYARLHALPEATECEACAFQVRHSAA